MQDAIKLKDTLLSTNLFIDNNYLADYISLVSNSTITDSYTEKHHVIQVAYYKHLYKCNRETAEKYADTDPNNFIVQLSYRDHCKAHWLLYFCTKSYLKQGNEKSVRYMVEMYKKLTLTSKSIFEFNDEDFNILQNYMNSIKADPDSRYYSKEEEDFLIKNYPEYGLDYCMQFLPNRSRRAVARYVSKLKLKRTNVFWTEDDENFLRLNYPVHGIRYCMEKLNRTRLMIKCKANYLGLKVINLSKYNRVWSDEEIDQLKNNYEQHGLDYCVTLLPGREKTAISKKASDLGLHYKRKPKKEN